MLKNEEEPFCFVFQSKVKKKCYYNQFAENINNKTSKHIHFIRAVCLRFQVLNVVFKVHIYSIEMMKLLPVSIQFLMNKLACSP